MALLRCGLGHTLQGSGLGPVAFRGSLRRRIKGEVCHPSFGSGFGFWGFGDDTQP